MFSKESATLHSQILMTFKFDPIESSTKNRNQRRMLNMQFFGFCPAIIEDGQELPSVIKDGKG